MNPVALDAESVPQEVINNELTVAIEKTKEELVLKAVEAAPVVSREEVVYSEKVVERETAPVLTNSPTGFQDFNLDVRATETPEEVLRSSEFVTAKNPTFASPAMDFGTPTSFAQIPEDKNEMVAVEASDWPSNFDFDALRECDKLVLLVRAGAKNGKLIERAVEQIRRQDLEIGGAFLFDEDKKLIKQYYR